MLFYYFYHNTSHESPTLLVLLYFSICQVVEGPNRNISTHVGYPSFQQDYLLFSGHHAIMAPPAAAIDIEILPESDTSTFTIPDRLTIQNVAKRRAASGKLIAGVAAVADVEGFKGRTQHVHKGKAKTWHRKY